MQAEPWNRGLRLLPSCQLLLALLIFFSAGGLGCSDREPRGVEPALGLMSSEEAFRPYRKKIAMVVGIDRYQGQIQDLRYAVEDARAIRDLLMKDLGFDEVHLLEDRQASRKTILLSLSKLGQTMEGGDQFLFFFAGHGVSFGSGDRSVGYLVPQDADGLDEPSLEASGIGMKDMSYRLDRLPAKHVLLIIDSCYSGFAATGSRSLSPNAKRYLDAITDQPARQVLTAGKRDEKVLESENWGHSAFLLEFLRGFKTRAADPDDNGIITLSELHGFLAPAVSILTKGKQNPQFFELGTDEGEFAFLLPSPHKEKPKQAPAENPGRPEERLITAVQRDAWGDLVAFCHRGAPWSPRSKKEAVDDIESGEVRYYVDWEEGRRTLIEVITGKRGKYLRTPNDHTELNNLGSLPDCE